MKETMAAGIKTINGVETLEMSRLDRISFSVLDYLNKNKEGDKTMRMDAVSVEGIDGNVLAQSKYTDSGETTLGVSFEPRESVEDREIYLWTANTPRKREARLGRVTLRSWLESKFPKAKQERSDFTPTQLARIEILMVAANAVNRANQQQRRS